MDQFKLSLRLILIYLRTLMEFINMLLEHLKVFTLLKLLDGDKLMESNIGKLLTPGELTGEIKDTSIYKKDSVPSKARSLLEIH